MVCSDLVWKKTLKIAKVPLKILEGCHRVKSWRSYD